MHIRDRFERDGWIRLPHRVDDAVLDDVRTSLEPRWPGQTHQRWTNAWRRHPAVADLAAEPSVLEALTELYGRRPIPFQTLDFQRGSEQRLHADAVHFDSLPTGWMCGVWVALEDVGPHQGPVQLVTGSHRLAELRPERVVGDPAHFDYAQYEDLVAEAVRGLPVEPFLCERGEVLVWHGDLVHGGAPRRDPAATRWSQVTHHVFEGAVCITPMRSELGTGSYSVRHPLFDISTGRSVSPVLDGVRVRFEHLADGRVRLIDPAERGPTGWPAVRSGIRAAARELRARVAVRRGP